MGAFSDVTARDINSVARTVGMLNRNRMYKAENKRRQGEFDSRAKENSDINTALSMRQEGKEVTGAMGLSPTSIARSSALHNDQRKAETSTRVLDFDRDVFNQTKKYIADASLSEGSDLDYLKKRKADTFTKFKALQNVRSELNKTKKGQYELMQSNAKLAGLMAKENDAYISMASEYFKSGDSAKVDELISKITNDNPHPVFSVRNSDGTYNLFFDPIDGNEPIPMSESQGLTQEQVLQKLSEIPNKQKMMALTADLGEIQEHNNNLKETTWVNRETDEKVDAALMRDTRNPKIIIPVVYRSSDGKKIEVGNFDMFRELYKEEPALADRKTEAEIRKIEQQTINSKSPKPATTIPGAILKNNPNATDDELLAINKKLKGNGGVEKPMTKIQANKEISSIERDIYKINSGESIMDMLGKYPGFSELLESRGIDPNSTDAKQRIMEYYESRLDELYPVAGKTRDKSKEVQPTGGPTVTHKFIPGQGLVETK